MKVIIALFFSLLFSVLLITPTVISTVHKCGEMSFFLDCNEEENEENSSVIHLEVKLLRTASMPSVLFLGLRKKKHLNFTSKNYISEYLKITTPPPEFIW